jgi:hypothetical protein
MESHFRNEGVLTLWKRGLVASMLREGSYSSIRMGLYGPIRSKLVNDEKEVPLSKKILAGLLSGGIGSCFVNPTDVVKIRIQGEIRVKGRKKVHSLVWRSTNKIQKYF